MTRRLSLGLLGITALFAAFAAPSFVHAQVKYPGEGGVNLDVPYVPTAQNVVNRMLELTKAGPNDIHYDLGSGDGRIVITAVRDFKVKKGVGVDIDPVRIKEANANAKSAGVSDRVTFHQTDLFRFNFKEATVLTLYLLPDVNIKLRPTILDMAPGTRVVSHAFTMGDWQADSQDTVDGENLYYWMVPAKVQGTWEWKIGQDNYRVELMQQYQNVTGTIYGPSGQAQLINTKLAGQDLKFEARIPRGGTPMEVRFSGKVKGNSAEAGVDVTGGQRAYVTATRVAPAK